MTAVEQAYTITMKNKKQKYEKPKLDPEVIKRMKFL